MGEEQSSNTQTCFIITFVADCTMGESKLNLNSHKNIRTGGG